MALTPAQRKAKLAAAEALLKEVDTDEIVQAPTPAAVVEAAAPVMAEAIVAAAPAIATAVAVAVPPAAPVAVAVAAAAKTPHAFQIAAGMPSLFQTLMSAAKLGWGKTQKG